MNGVVLLGTSVVIRAVTLHSGVSLTQQEFILWSIRLFPMNASTCLESLLSLFFQFKQNKQSQKTRGLMAQHKSVGSLQAPACSLMSFEGSLQVGALRISASNAVLRALWPSHVLQEPSAI